jgi:hypothetical protein
MRVNPWRLALLVASALLVTAGVALAYLPAGIIVLGIEGFASLYAVSYLEDRK